MGELRISIASEGENLKRGAGGRNTTDGILSRLNVQSYQVRRVGI